MAQNLLTPPQAAVQILSPRSGIFTRACLVSNADLASGCVVEPWGPGCQPPGPPQAQLHCSPLCVPTALAHCCHGSLSHPRPSSRFQVRCHFPDLTHEVTPSCPAALLPFLPTASVTVVTNHLTVSPSQACLPLDGRPWEVSAFVSQSLTGTQECKKH